MMISKLKTVCGLVFLMAFSFESTYAQADGIWMSKAEISKLPMSGDAWNGLVKTAQGNANDPDLKNQDDKTDTNTLAKALVYARTGDQTYANEVLYALQRVVELNPISRSLDWDTLGALRSLGSYAIAADLIDLKSYAPDFDKQRFRPWLSQARFADTEGGRGSVAENQEKRPNNFGTHGSASRIAASVYLGDQADIERASVVFRGWLGDRSAYSGFKYGDLSWQANPGSPVGINPKGSKIDGHNVDGVLPDDARRCGSFKGSFCKSGYMWEGLQGVVTAAELLYRAGYPSYEWSDRAILRSMQWLHNTTFSDGKNYPAEGDDRWVTYIINKRYGKTFQTGSSATSPGKMMGFTDWTHSASSPTTPTPEPPTTTPEPPTTVTPDPETPPTTKPESSNLSLVSSQFWSSTGNLALVVKSATPGATVTVSDANGNTLAFGKAPSDGSSIKLRQSFYSQNRSCNYSVTDGGSRIAFVVKGSPKYGCGVRR